MKKLILKDCNLRTKLKLFEKKCFILKFIFKNFNYPVLVRWVAFLKLELLTKNKSKTLLLNRCLIGKNKKRFNKLTVFSRHIFLKLLQNGFISDIQKSTW